MRVKNLQEWRRIVLLKDQQICQICGEKNSKILLAHHIKPKDQYPKEVLKVKNGTTECYHCHSLMPMQLKLFRIDDGYKGGYWYPKRLLRLANSEFYNQPI